MPETSNSEERLGGNITLINFKLEPIELIVVKKIVGNYAKKLAEKSGYKELKLRLRQHEHGKSFLHELNVEAVVSKDKEGGADIILNTSAQDYNLFSALANALEKLLSEAESKIKV